MLALRTKTVKDAMTWLPDVYALDINRKTDAELSLEVHKHGFSRIPVYANEKSIRFDCFNLISHFSSSDQILSVLLNYQTLLSSLLNSII